MNTNDITTEAALAMKITAVKRKLKEAEILDAAEVMFAQYGFAGASLEDIGARLGMSRHSLLYYYPSKDTLYLAVLNRVLDIWLESMSEISEGANPQEALSDYIGSKIRFSQEHPYGSRVFTQEIITGAPYFKDVLETRVKPQLEKDIAALERWADEGLIRRLDFMHFMFGIWAVTQSYADLAPQFALLLGKAQLEATDFTSAERMLSGLVLRGLALDK